ncbi:hypothetical protein D3C72_2436940 [compost metagenome]
MTVPKESVPEVPRDSPLWKRVGSSAAFRMTVKAFWFWVRHELFSYLSELDLF